MELLFKFLNINNVKQKQIVFDPQTGEKTIVDVEVEEITLPENE